MFDDATRDSQLIGRTETSQEYTAIAATALACASAAPPGFKTAADAYDASAWKASRLERRPRRRGAQEVSPGLVHDAPFATGHWHQFTVLLRVYFRFHWRDTQVLVTRMSLASSGHSRSSSVV